MNECFVNIFTQYSHRLSNDFTKWLDHQIIDTGVSALGLIIKGLDNQAQELTYQINQYLSKRLIVYLGPWRFYQVTGLYVCMSVCVCVCVCGCQQYFGLGTPFRFMQYCIPIPCVSG